MIRFRVFAAAGLIFFGVIFISASPAYGKSKVQRRQEAKECNDKYNRDRDKCLAQSGLTQAQKNACENVIYDDLVACMKDKGLLSMLPNKPVKSDSTPVPNGGSSTSGSTRSQRATDAQQDKSKGTATSAQAATATKLNEPKKTTVAPRGPRQTGSNLP